MKLRATMDYETRSRSNLKVEGAYKYSLDPSTRATCLSVKILGDPKICFLPFHLVNKPWKELPLAFREFWSNLIDEGYLFSAHNAFFETCIYKNIMVKRLGWPDIPFRRFRCTAAKAAACALPRNLEGAAEAMKQRVQKDKRGFAAMMATCKPTRAFNDWHKMKKACAARKALGKLPTPKQRKWLEAAKACPPEFLEPEAAPHVFETLYTYCKIDSRAEEELDESLPDLSDSEQELWFLNQRLNWRGLRFDIPTVQKITTIMGSESEVKLKELDSLTMGLVTKPGSRRSILEFLALDGIELPDIKAKTVSDALKDGNLGPDMRRLLELRQAFSKTSTRKYQGIVNRAMPDGRCRDILLFHGASTGRDTGTGIQPHNFPRGMIKVSKDRPYAAIENVIELDAPMLRILYGENLAYLFSSILRNTIIPADGKELYVSDFSKIEVAVLWWLAGNMPGIKILQAGLDPYKYQAAKNTGKDYMEIQDEGPERQLGKAQILGCGFGMGWGRFQESAETSYSLKLSDDDSKDAVKSYREANAAVPLLWKAYENAAIGAVKKKGKVFTAGKCKFYFKGRFLWVELPSGRKLAYCDPQISWRVHEYEVTETVYDRFGIPKVDKDGNEIKTTKMVQSEPRETVEFWAPHSKTKKWGLERIWGGTWAENLTQATARDLMMYAMLRLEKAGYDPLLMVHDEGITEKTKGEGSVDEFKTIMCEPPEWADESLVIQASGWKGPRYRK